MPTLRRTGATLIATAALVGGTGTVAAEAAQAAQATEATEASEAAKATAPAITTARKATAKAASTAVSAAARRKTSKKLSRKARNKSIARPMVRARGWSSDQYACLVRLWNRESDWNHFARNPGSGAYGIPQALPAGKMAGAGRDWRTNPKTQIKWGLRYIKGRYGTPCAAWAHSRSRGWY